MHSGYAEKTGRGSSEVVVAQKKERRSSSFDANTNGDTRRPMTRLARVQRRLPRGLEARAKRKKKENREKIGGTTSSVGGEGGDERRASSSVMSAFKDAKHPATAATYGCISERSQMARVFEWEEELGK